MIQVAENQLINYWYNQQIQHVTSLLQGIQPIAGNIKNKIKRDMIKIILQPIMEIN